MATMVGVARGVVIDDVDPTGAGRLLVRLGGPRGKGTWAIVAGLPAATGTTVIVAFDGGDSTRPVVVGALPGAGDVWALPGGSTLRFDRQAGDLALEHASGASVSFTAAGCTVRSPATVTIEASAVEVRASMTKLVSAMVKTLGWIKAHKPAEIAAKMPADYAGGDPKLYEKAVADSIGMFNADGVMPADGAKNVLNVLAQFSPNV